MGICGSAGAKKDDEVWQRGSFSVGRSSSPANNGDKDEDLMDENDMKARMTKVAKQRKRLTLQGQDVGKINLNQSDAKIHEEATKVEDMATPVAHKDFQDCHYVALSKKGFVPYDEKVNQDSLICLESVKHNIPDLDMHFFAVLDGHGHYGRNVSQEITATFPKALTQQLARFTKAEELTDETVSKILHDAIDKCATDILKTKIPLQHSGTTFIGSLIFNNTIYTANVGDSQGMVLQTSNTEPYEIYDLNYLHNPDVPEERARIEKAGGKVAQIPGLPKSEAGPFRIWLPDMSGPGLAMARSIGDTIAHGVGAIHAPTINIKRIDPSCKYVLWASDGVFEFLTTSDVAEIIIRSSDLKDMAKNIVKTSVKMWRKYDQVVDDITVVILQLPEIQISE